MRNVLAFMMSFLVIVPVFAASLFDRTVNERPLYDIIVSQGVPEPALRRVFEFIDINKDKKFWVKSSEGKTLVSIDNQEYAVVIDFSQVSTRKRLYFINLESGQVEKYFVAHGVNTGDNEALRFANVEESRKSSLGIYLTGKTYYGKYGESLNLYGTEKSNDLAHMRRIVMHPADYVSPNFIEKYGRLGRSYGCPAVESSVAKVIIPKIKEGAVIYAYHPTLMSPALTSTSVEVVSSDKKNTTSNSHKLMPEEM